MAISAIRTVGLGKRFGAVSALADLDLELGGGEVLGYLGPNGAGKTTTLRLLLGLIRPTSGRAEVFGVDAWHDAPRAHRRLAYVPGDVSLWPALTGAETLQLLGNLHGRVDASYRDELIDRFAFDPSRRTRTYSKGNRQKLALIAALMTRADLLLLDEPTSGLDPLMEQAFRLSIDEAKEHGQAVLLSSHILSEVEALSDRIALLRGGRIVDLGTMDQLRHLSAMTIEVSFEGTVADLSSVPGVSDIEVAGSTVRCRVVPPVDALLRALARYPVTRLTSREASLEEVFLRHYATAGEGDTTGDRTSIRA